MSDGFLLIDKPAGPTSHDVIDMVRRALRVRRIGHAGTLDPFATGLLVVLVGRATRLSRFLVGLTKRYTGTIRLGTTTDTFDRTGQVQATDESWTTLSDDRIQGEASKMLGHHLQRAPVYSAKKIDGVPAHRRVRRGELIDAPEHDIEVLQFTCGPRRERDVEFDATVSSGTYMRAMAADLGERLGCGAHLTELRREAVGTFTVDDAVAPDALSAAHIRPPLGALEHLPGIEISEVEREAVSHGRSIERLPSDGESGPVTLRCGTELLAVAERSGNLLEPKVVLAS